MNWYIERNGAKAGPFTTEELAAEVRTGGVQDHTLVWRTGLANWVRFSSVAAEVPGLADDSEVPPLPTAASLTGGAAFPASGQPEARTSPQFREVASDVGEALSPGGFWARGAARVIDSIAVFVIAQITVNVIGNAFFKETVRELEKLDPFTPLPPERAMEFLGFATMAMFIMVSVWTLYEWVFLAWMSATPGKRFLGLRVADLSGAPLSVARALGRTFGYMLTSFTLGIGLLVALGNDRKQAMHDYLCQTVVLRKRG